MKLNDAWFDDELFRKWGSPPKLFEKTKGFYTDKKESNQVIVMVGKRLAKHFGCDVTCHIDPFETKPEMK